MSIPWIEKYRPRKIEDMILDDMLRTKISNFIQSKTIPNLLISGPPGIGKTTLIKCIINSLFGKYSKQAVLELNASDERGIKSVQETIKNFCKNKMDLGKHENNYPTFKIVLLDEADNMTEKAQILINILMEQYYSNIRFALTCNTSSDIIESIQSRTNIIKLQIPDEISIYSKLKFICSQEHIKIKRNLIKEIANNCNGDVRTSINYLQLISNNTNTINPLIDKKLINYIDKIFVNCYEKDFINALILVHQVKDQGYSLLDIMQNMFLRLKTENFNLISDDIKIKFFDIISQTLYIISKGIENNIELSACIADMCNI